MARDSGNRLNQARSLTIAARRKQLSESIGAGDPADFFRFRLSDRSRSSFSLSQLRANADLALLNDRGRVIRQSRRPGNRTEEISRTLAAGVYYLRVSPRTGQDSTRYQLRYSAVPAASPSPSPGPTPTPRNTNPTIATSGLSVIRGTTATLNSNLLSATDAEQPVSALTYTLTTLPQSGSLLFNNEVITAPRTFTQADIAAGRLTYLNRGSVRPLQTTTTINRNPQISGSNVVWEGSEGADFEIIYSDGNTTRSLTSNSVDDRNPKISGSNVVWQEDTGSSARILLRNLNTPASTPPIQLSLVESTENINPVISGVNVAWQARGGIDRGSDFEIFLWNGTSVRQITNNDSDDVNVQISGSNLAWQNENVGVTDSEIFFWNGTQVQQLTNNNTDDQLPQISGSNVVWQGAINNNFEIFFSNGSGNPPVRLTNNSTPDLNPQISGSNVVWQNTVSNTASTIFLTTVGGTPTAPIALSPTAGFANNPQISGSNIVWRGAATAGSSLELFFSDRPDAPPVQLTSNSSTSNLTPRISGGNVVWTRSPSPNATESQVFLISAARQDSFGFTVADGVGGSTNGTFNFTIG